MSAQESRAPHILLRSSWQVVNIGDIAHTPGVLALIEKYIPEAEVILWASGDLSAEVAAMEHHRFPKLKIVKGTIKADGSASNPELAEAIAWSDFLLHGSGPSLVAAKDVAAYVKHTGKPFGVWHYTRLVLQTELMANVTVQTCESAFAQFNRLEEKVDRQEALSEAWDRMDGKDPDAMELERKLDAAERSDRLAEELAQLKASVAGT